MGGRCSSLNEFVRKNSLEGGNCTHGRKKKTANYPSLSLLVCVRLCVRACLLLFTCHTILPRFVCTQIPLARAGVHDLQLSYRTKCFIPSTKKVFYSMESGNPIHMHSKLH